MYRFLLLLTILSFGLATLSGITPAARSADIDVYAALDRLSFPVDQGAVLMVTIEGASRGGDIEMPELPDGIQVDSRGQSSKINMINGNFSASVVHNYVIRAEKPGDYTIGPITVKAGGSRYQTSPIHFSVTASELMNESGTAAKNDIAFMKVSISPDHYLGESVPATIAVYFTDRYQANINSLPELTGDGAVMTPLDSKPEQSRETYKGRTYNVLTWKTTLSGVKAGAFSLRFGLDATILIPERNSSGMGRSNPFDDPFFRNSPFGDSFFGSMFGNVQRRELHIESDPVPFTVSALPQEGRPENFSGAIGDFQFHVDAHPLTAEAGEPITLTISITGEGNLDSIVPPQLSPDHDWKTYTPIDSSQAKAHSFSGTKTFEQAIVCKNSKITHIPGLAFSYFNPKSKQYITKSSQPIPITIKAGQEPQTNEVIDQKTGDSATNRKVEPQPAERQAQPLPGLAPIKIVSGPSQKNIKPLFMSGWYIALWMILLIMLIFSIGYRIWHRRFAGNPDRQAKKLRDMRLQQDLEKMKNAIVAEDAYAFVSESKKAIQNQLGLCRNISPSAITLANLEIFDSKEIFSEIFKMADAVLYGGSEPPLTVQEMQHYLEKLQTELGALC